MYYTDLPINPISNVAAVCEMWKTVVKKLSRAEKLTWIDTLLTVAGESIKNLIVLPALTLQAEAMKANVFIGEVIERAVETPREISLTRKVGLASPPPTWRGRSLAAQVPSMNPNFASAVSQTPTPVLSNDERSTIDSDASMKQIMQMSPEELQAAQREIAAMFKPENLAYLQKMATKGSFGDPKISESRKLPECAEMSQVN